MKYLLIVIGLLLMGCENCYENKHKYHVYANHGANYYLLSAKEDGGCVIGIDLKERNVKICGEYVLTEVNKCK